MRALRGAGGGVDYPKGHATTLGGPAEVERLIETVAPRWRGLILVLAYGGLRFGEAAGLRARDIVIGGVYIAQAVKENSKGLSVGSVKDHEERFVELPPTIVRRLRDYGRLGPLSSDDLVFTTSRGGLLSASSFHTQVWERALVRAGFEDRRLHVLRAFAASLWLDSGASIEYVRDQLGHADLRTTQKYLGLFRRSRRAVIDELEDRLYMVVVDREADQLRTTPESQVTQIGVTAVEHQG